MGIVDHFSVIIVLLLVLATIAVFVTLLRWALRTNHMVALQEEILANLRHISANIERRHDDGRP